VVTLDDVMPHPQYRMCHARIISAPPAAVWDELRRLTMSALPLGYALESIRLLPARLAGRRHRPLAERTFLDVTPIPVLFCRPPRVVISAGLSQAWRLLGGLTPPRLDAAGLRAWSQPGWIKVAMEFRLELTSAGTWLSTETRVAATDRRTGKAFAVYWFFIRAGSSAIRREVLSVVADRAERRARPGATTQPDRAGEVLPSASVRSRCVVTPDLCPAHTRTLTVPATLVTTGDGSNTAFGQRPRAGERHAAGPGQRAPVVGPAHRRRAGR